MTLQDTVNQLIENGVITLTGANASISTGLSELLTTFFGGKLSGTVTIQPGHATDFVRVQGTLSGFFSLYRGGAACSLEISFTQAASDILVSVTVGIASGYRFADSFPIFTQRPGDVFNLVDVKTISFTMSSATPTSPALVTANVANRGPFGHLDWISDSLTLSGSLTTGTLDATQTVPICDLSATLASSASLGFAEGIEAVFTAHLSSTLVTGAYPTGTTFLWSSAYLEADLGAGSVTIPILMHLGAGESAPLLLSIDYCSTQGISLTDGFTALSSIVSADSITSALPSNMAGLARLTLDRFSITLDPRRMMCSNLVAGVKLDCDWSIFDGKFELKDIGAIVTLPDLGKKSGWELFLNTHFTIAGSSFEASVSLPEIGIQARLSPGSTIDATALLSHLVPGISMPGTADLEIHVLDLSGDLSSKTFSADLELAGSLKVVTGLELDSLGLSLSYGNGAVERFDLSSGFILGTTTPVHIGLEGSYVAGSGSPSWHFSGRTLTPANIPLSTLMSEVFGTFFGVTTISPPSILATTEIGDISMSYDTGSKEFDFGLELTSAIPFHTFDEKFGFTGQGTSAPPTTTPASSPSVATISFRKSTTSSGSDYHLGLKIQAGLKLLELFGMEGLFPGGFDPTLDEIDLSFDTGHDKKFLVDSTFSNNGNTVEVTGLYDKSVSSAPVQTAAFAGRIGSSAGHPLAIDFKSAFPLTLSIHDLFLAKITISGTGYKILGSSLDVKGDLDLGSLPVLGGFLSDAKFEFQSLRIVYTSASISSTNLDLINGILGEISVDPLLTSRTANVNAPAGSAPYPAGFTLQGTLVLGNGAHTIPLHTGYSNAAAGAPASTTPGTPAPGAGGTGTGSGGTQPTTSPPAGTSTPTPVGKRFGPITIDSVSLGLKNGKIAFTFTGGLTLGPVTFDLIGFEIESRPTSFSPSLSLQGLSLSVTKPPLTLSGLFEKTTITLPTGPAIGAESPPTTTVDGYNGSLSIGYKQYSLTAMGSYAALPDGSASIFLYGFLGAPLGGPPFLFITGVAAGFGYNRDITIPTAATVRSSPLVAPVLPAGTPVDFDAMNLEFLPAENAYWFAVGVRIESFKMIESFVLLIVKMGTELEIDIIGTSQMQFPIPKEGETDSHPLANIVIGVVATILPDQGVLSIRGEFLSGSYVFNPAAQITGGFALLSLFADQNEGSRWYPGKEGDFVITIGGYGPLYTPKSYYPTVPRLEMNWRVSDNLQLTASAYFAITPEAMMLGGSLDAHFHAGGTFSIDVHFTVSADFLVYWKPFRYLGQMSAELSVSASLNIDCWLFTIHIGVSFDLSADLEIWGPKFSGHASVHVHVIISFTVGISFGDASPTIVPIDWSEFHESFLPSADKIITGNIGTGMIANQSTPASASTAAVNVVNAKDLTVSLGTAIPIRSVTVNGSPITSIPAVSGVFGVKPMGMTSTDFSVSEFEITINFGGTPLTTYADHFAFTPVTRNLPAALWQPAATSGAVPANDGTALIENLLNGVTLAVLPPREGASVTVGPVPMDVLEMQGAGWGAAFSYGTAGFTRQGRTTR